MLELKPGLADRGSIGPVAEDRGILAVQRTLRRQFIDAFEQRRTGDWRFTARAFGPGFIDRLGYCSFVLAQLLEGTLEVDVGVRGVGLGQNERAIQISWSHQQASNENERLNRQQLNNAVEGMGSKDSSNWTK